MNTTTITVESLIRLSTCVLCVDVANEVVWVSECLRRLIGSDCVGKNLVDLVASTERPLISLALRIEGKGVLPLRGDWLPLEEGRGRVFVGSPAPETTEEMTSLGIGLDDYLERDSWLNYLIKSDESNSTQKDAVERIEQLKQQHVKLTIASDQMADARKASMNMMLDLEQARIAAESATRAKSDFLANMSHEIRTPMTAILGFSENLLDPDLADQERISAIHTIHRNGEYLLGIINDILDLSKIEAGKMTLEQIRSSPCRIIAEVASLIGPRAESKNVVFCFEYIGRIPETILTDSTRLRQILINLIGNAIKFTEKGGVRLITRLREENGVTQLQFDVVDTGIGMTQKQAAKLFEAFTQADATTTRKFGGTGLGLTISKYLAQKLGGDIEVVESEEGIGTRFRATIATGPLDAVRMLDNPMAATSVDDPVSLKNKATIKLDCRVLLAEDGPDNQRLVSYLLKKAGADVETVENGREAVNATLAARETDDAFDVILMDMQMPIMDGYEATTLLRQKKYTGPIIALTAHTMANDRKKCIDAGCDDYVAKPINRKKLLESIRKHTERMAAALA